MKPDIQITVRLVSQVCGQCGITFAMPDYLKAALLENGESFYCPMGHCRVFTKRASLEKQLEEARRSLTAAQCAKIEAVHDLQREREARAKDSAATKRLHASGKCPCCRRAFASLARHIRRMHPDYLKQERKPP